MTERKGHTVLIVDDEPDIRSFIADRILEEGINVLEAPDGEAALDLINSGGIDLILTDMHMPNMDGIKLLEQISSKQNFPRLIFMTGNFQMSVEEAFEKGAEAIFSKPLDLEALIMTIKESLSEVDSIYSRKFKRISTNFDVDIAFKASKEVIKTKTLNIAQGGMFIELAEGFPNLEDDLTFKLEFNESNFPFIEGFCVAKWIRSDKSAEFPAGVGVEFINLTDQSRKYLYELINAIRSKVFIPI